MDNPDACACDRTFELLLKIHPDVDRAITWLNSGHRELAYRSPLSVMLTGRSDVVRDMLEAALHGLPT